MGAHAALPRDRAPAASGKGSVMASVVTAALSLVLAAVVAIKVVPYLAHRTALERWMIKVEYQFTREGVVYFLIIMVIAVAGPLNAWSRPARN